MVLQRLSPVRLRRVLTLRAVAMCFLVLVPPARVRAQGDLGGWDLEDIGAPVTESVSFDAGCFDVKTSGGSLGEDSDAATFIYQEVKGDAAVTVRLDALAVTFGRDENVAVQLRQSLDPTSRFAASAVRFNNRWQPVLLFRENRGDPGRLLLDGQSDLIEWPFPPAAWLRIERHGDVLAALSSADNVRWLVTAEHVFEQNFPEALLAGASFVALASTLTARVCDLAIEPGEKLLPVPRVTGPHAAEEGQEVRLDATASLAGGGKITIYTWDFGDGGTAKGPTAGHVYLDPKVYRVILTLTDGDGRLVERHHELEVLKASPGEEWRTVNLPGAADGKATVNGDCHQVTASGGDVISALDTSTFTYKEARGHTILTGRVVDVMGATGFASIGLMIRESLEAGVRHGFAMLFEDTLAGATRPRYSFGWRLEKAGREGYLSLLAPGDPVPVLPEAWLRIERDGDTLIGSYAEDGKAWKEITRKTFDPPLPEVLLAGVAVTSHCGAGGFCEIPIEVTMCEVRLVDSTSPPQPTFRRGDADSSGHVDLTDAIFLLNHLFKGGGAPTCPDSADANDDGKLNLTDAVHVATYLFRSGAPPAPPGPEECGEDRGEADGLAECEGGGCG